MKNKLCLAAILMILAPLCMRGQDAVSLTLEDCRRMALERNRSVRNAELDLLGAQERRREVMWEFVPRVSAMAGAFYSMDPMVSIGLKDVLGTSPDALALVAEMHDLAYSYGISPYYNALDKGSIASVSVAQPVFLGGRLVNGMRLASLGVDASVLKKEISERDVLEEVEQAWWDVVSLQEKEKTLLAASRMLDSLYKDVDAAVQAGLAATEDRMQVELQRSTVRSGLTKLRDGLALARMALCSKTGARYSSDMTFVCDGEDLLPPETFWRDEDSLLASQKESQLLDMAGRARDLERRMAMGEAMPSIAVGGAFGYSDFISASVNATVFATLRIPLTEWGKTSHKMRRAGYEYEKAMNDKASGSEQLMLKIRMLWMNAVSAWDSLADASDAFDLARRQADTAEAGYDAGVITLSQLMQAQTALRQSEDALSDARIAYRIAIMKYRNL